MRFFDIPLRGYSKTDPGWWNALRSAGLNLESAGFIPETDFAFANNQSTPANVTGCLVSNSTNYAAKIDFLVRRNTASNEILSWVELYLVYSAASSAWQIVDDVEHGASSGITWSVTSGGQIQYTSNNLAGTGYADTSKFRLTGFSNI